MQTQPYALMLIVKASIERCSDANIIKHFKGGLHFRHHAQCIIAITNVGIFRTLKPSKCKCGPNKKGQVYISLFVTYSCCSNDIILIAYISQTLVQKILIICKMIPYFKVDWFIAKMVGDRHIDLTLLQGCTVPWSNSTCHPVATCLVD